MEGFEDFPLPAPPAVDASKPRHVLLDEMETAIAHDRRVLRGWGLSERLIKKQEDWRRRKYKELLDRGT